MTRKSVSGQWALQDAKAQFSEVVRRAKSEGPQHITVHGREEVVVVSINEYQRVKGERTGDELVQLLQDSPLRDVPIDHEPVHAAVRGARAVTARLPDTNALSDTYRRLKR